MQYLMPAVTNSSYWDVLVGHYLGVDHAGHSGDVWSADMDAKLSQMDDQMEQVCPSGKYDARLFVLALSS